MILLIQPIHFLKFVGDSQLELSDKQRIFITERVYPLHLQNLYRTKYSILSLSLQYALKHVVKF